MKNVMIDLETFGTSQNSVFLSIAAVSFTFEESTHDAKIFQANVSLDSGIDLGLTLDADTIMWWLTQKPEVMQRMFVDVEPVLKVLGDFSNWWHLNRFVHPWGNSASFDLGILGNAYRKAKFPIPWEFWNERCYRTAMAMLPEVKIDK